jgi:hypothetical protein
MRDFIIVLGMFNVLEFAVVYITYRDPYVGGLYV